MDETFSSIDFVTQCLTDSKRTEAFRRAIEKAVKPGDVVLDSGTGSGVLALLAARAGAKKVIAVEYDPYVARLAKQNFEQNGYTDTIELVTGDVRKLELEQPLVFDVVLMEMLTTGMVDEYQVWAINNLHEKGYVKESTLFVPAAQETYLSLTQMDFSVEGLNMRMVRHLWYPFPTGDIVELTEKFLLNRIPFNVVNETGFSSTFRLQASKSGVINSVYLTSITLLDDELSVADTLSLNAPVIVPLPEDLQVQQGDTVECSVQYQFGNGYRNFSAKAVVI